MKNSNLNKGVFSPDSITEKHKNGSSTKLLSFEFGSLSFMIIYTSQYFTGQDLLEFHATSTGLEQISETGYKSKFSPSVEHATREMIEEYWINFASQCGLDLLDVQPRQLSLF